MRLRKRLCGLRQSPKNWHSTVDTYVIKNGFKTLKSDLPVYVYYTDDDPTKNSTSNTSRKPDPILTLYVDNLMFAGGDKTVLKMLKVTPMSRFATTDMRDISFMLGMQVTPNRENGTLIIPQANYTSSALEKYGTGDCKLVNTPGAGKCLSFDQPEGNLLNRKATVSGDNRFVNVTSSSDSIRHPLQRQSACAGDVKAIQGTHGGGQARSPIPCRDDRLRHHLQERGFHPNRVFGC